MGFHCAFIAAIVVCATSIIAQNFGELLVLRQTTTTRRSTLLNLTCISEDDDSALIWNNAPKDFQSVNPRRNNVSGCAIWDSRQCRARWNDTIEWKVVESAIRPMAPVYDFRWEGFKEYSSDKEIKHSKYQYLGKVNQTSGNAVFSVRGEQDVHVLLCENEDQTKGPCVWIIIGGWKGEISLIRYCAAGAPPDTRLPQDHNCSQIVRKEFDNTYILDSKEWRTFRLTWTSDEKIIRLFGDAGHEEETILQGEVERWLDVSHISVRLDKSSRVRFHFYEYLLTEDNGSVLYTEEFDFSEEEFCVELLVGLCPKCELNVNLVDNNGHNFEIGNIFGDKESVYKGMLTWRSKRLSKNIRNDDRDLGKSLKLEIRAILTEGEGEGRWAMDNFRTCKPAGQRRESTISLPSIQSNVRCQKLSYNGSIVVDPWSSAKITSNTIESRNFIDELVESCGPSCKSFGVKSLLCYSMGCTCDRGYRGSNCDRTCAAGYHGYNCDETCEPCPIGSCDRITGLCATCSGSKTFLPPLCGTEIEKPTVTNITDTTAIVSQKIELGAGAETSVDVVIQVKSSESCMNFTANLEKPGTPFYYKSYTSDLSMDTMYTVHTIVSVKLGDNTLSATSPETNFATTCFMRQDFVITPGKNEIKVSPTTEKVCVYSKSPDYLVRVYRLEDNEPMGEHVDASFPSPFNGLTPYTEYKVIITDERTNRVLFTGVKRTLESAPSEVKNLSATSTTEDATLRWDPPLERNGLIRNYSVSLTGQPIACERSGVGGEARIVKLQTVNETTLKIPGLHPYANYTASVIAYTSESGKPKTVTFQTSKTDIPRSKFSNFTLGNKNQTLYWGQPLDCTTITGSTETAALVLENIDNPAEKDIRRQTRIMQYHVSKFNATPYTMYRVRLYVIRGYDQPFNSTSYQELTWRSPATPPPPVKGLEVYEADIDTNTISLGWIPPNPANGQIKSYQVSIKQKNHPISTKNFKVWEGRPKCELREGYVCFKNVEIPKDIARNNIYEMEICAVNEGVRQAGAPTSYSITPRIYEKEPSAPTNLTWTFQSHGIMMLNWVRQTFSRTKITEFYINVHQTRTKLKKNEIHEFSTRHPAETNQTEYSVELHLLTSTDYVVSIVAVNRRNFTSKESNISISVPGSIAYANGANLTVKQTGSFIEVQTPAVANATDNTTVKVYVKGTTTCTRANSSGPSTPVKMTEWLAAVWKVEDDKPRNLTIGDIHNHGVPLDCSLHMGKTYHVEIIAMDGYTRSTTAELTSAPITLRVIEPQKSNLTWLVIVAILVIFPVVIFVVYRKWRSFKLANEMRSSTDQSIALWDQSELPTPSCGMKDDRSTSQKIVPDVVPYNPYSYPVEIHKFEEYTREELASGLLKSQYEKFTRGLTRPCAYGRLPENKSKNRYNDLIAYDDTRVVLEKIPGDNYSDYINASYIQGYRKNKAYIATQGPKSNTVNDFWRMIWQEKVRVICMLANVIEGGKRKCEQYWPNVGDKAKYGEILVTNVDHQIFVDYTFRTFTLAHQKQIREVTHLHYTGWPDHGVPMYTQSLVPYLKKLLDIESGDGPIVVHCSAGVGRTGTIILCDTCLRSAREERVVDLPAVTLGMRQRRANMVDNAQQYLLAHLVIVECLVSEETQIPCRSLSHERIEKLRKQLPSDIQRLKDTVWQDRALHSLAAPTFLDTEAPTNDGINELHPALDPSPAFDSQSKYITAVGVDGVKMKNQYLASRLPSPANRSDLWRLIAQENVELVIMLQRPDPDDPTYCDVISGDLNTVRVSRVEVGAELLIEEDDNFTIEKYIYTRRGGEPQPLTVLTCTKWGHGVKGKPPPAVALVSLWQASEKISRQEGPTFVLCHDGVTGCGLYLALSFLLERMSVAGECDVISAVRAVRRFKPEFVKSPEQFEYLYDAAVKYGECFETYANFS